MILKHNNIVLLIIVSFFLILFSKAIYGQVNEQELELLDRGRETEEKLENSNTNIIDDNQKNYIPILKLNYEIRTFFLKLSRFNQRILKKQEILTLDTLYTRDIDSLKTIVDNINAQNLQQKSILELSYLKRFLKTALDDLEQKSDYINSKLNDLEETNKYVTKKIRLWNNSLDTLNKMDSVNKPFKLITYIKIIVDTLGYYKDISEDNMYLLLKIEEKINLQQYKIERLIKRIEDIKIDKRAKIFSIDYEPIWKAFQKDTTSISFKESLSKVYDSEKKSIDLFFNSNKNNYYVHIAIFLVILIILLYFRFTYHKQDIVIPLSTFVPSFEFKNLVYRPISSSIFIALFASFFIYTNRNDFIDSVLFFLIYLIIIRLLWGIISKRNMIYFGGFGILYLINILVKIIEGDVAVQRWLILFNTIAFLATLLYLFKPKSKIYNIEKGAVLKFLFAAVPFFIILLTASLVANIIGAVGFSILATTGFTDLTIVTFILIAASYLLASISIVLLTKHFRKKPELEEKYLANISYTVINLIRFFIIIAWIFSGTRFFGIREIVNYWFDELLNFTITSGNTEIQIGAILTFFMILIVSFVTAKVIRIFLDVEVFSRIRMPRGIPGAITMVIKYSIVFIGIYLAISSIGFDFTKFGLLAGAIGLGLGFGLQNIISNFVSGIILAFERPVQTGDIVEVNNVYGKVQSIGVRSSIVRTLDGSEVILPNNDLISKQLINWTMNDTKRRIKLQIKTAFGENPHEVIETTLKAIKEFDEVLKKPEPFVTFDGFGNHFLEFTAYYWLSEKYLINKSKIAIGIYDKLVENNIETPRLEGDFNLNLKNGNNLIDNTDINNKSKDDTQNDTKDEPEEDNQNK